MKQFYIFIFLSVFSTFSFAEDVILQDENIPFFYESRAEIPAQDQKLASYISVEYRQAKDEFTRHDLFQKIKPVLDKHLQTAKQTQVVKLRVNIRIGEYSLSYRIFRDNVYSL